MSTPEIEELKRLIQEKYGKKLNTTTDFEEFSFHLDNKESLSVSSSTLKRLFGYVADSHKPRTQTLDMLAQYLGYRDFCKLWNGSKPVPTIIPLSSRLDKSSAAN